MAVIPLHGLGAVSVIDFEAFTRSELAEAFGVTNGSMLTNDCQWLNNLAGKFNGFDRIQDGQPLNRTQAWFVYAMECWRRMMLLNGYESTHRKQFVKQLLEQRELGDRAVEAFVVAGGGSRDDFERRIKKIQIRKRCKKLGGTAIEVDFTPVAN